MNKPTPANCPHCEYDRRFPGFQAGGWMQQDNNGPIVSCPMCNDDGSHPPQTCDCYEWPGKCPYCGDTALASGIGK